LTCETRFPQSRTPCFTLWREIRSCGRTCKKIFGLNFLFYRLITTFAVHKGFTT
jgi:hypothetical protein